MALPKPGFLRVAWELAWPYWRSDEKWSARGLLAAVVVLNLTSVWLHVRLNAWNNDFYNTFEKRDQAEIVLEVRSGGVSIDRLEFLLGIPAAYIPWAASTAIPLATPELAIIKSTRQNGFASIAFVAYVAKTGELIAASGPFVGRTKREDFWFFGTGPRTVGDIPPVERER